jgi:hypothetical protein
VREYEGEEWGKRRRGRTGVIRAAVRNGGLGCQPKGCKRESRGKEKTY